MQRTEGERASERTEGIIVDAEKERERKRVSESRRARERTSKRVCGIAMPHPRSARVSCGQSCWSDGRGDS